MSADLSSGETLRAVKPDTGRMVRVQTLFRVADELHGEAVAAKLIDRAHEIANLPECECDVDVSVEWVAPDDPAGAGGVPTDRRSASGHSAER